MNYQFHFLPPIMQLISRFLLGMLSFAGGIALAEGFRSPPDYAAYATGPSIRVANNTYQFLPQARAKRRGSSSDNNITTTQSVNNDAFLMRKGSYDIYLDDEKAFAAISNAVKNNGCGYCQVLYNLENRDLALFTNDLIVRLRENTLTAAQQLADTYQLRLKRYMQRIGLAVYTASNAEDALNTLPLLAADISIIRVRHSLVEHTYKPR